MKIIQKVKIWWRGEFLHPTTEELFDQEKESEDKFKQPLIPSLLTTMWRFWVRHWKILFPLIVTVLVMLFIHFDSKTTNEPTQIQKDTNQSSEKIPSPEITINKDVVTSHNQSGGITAHTVNLKPVPRTMNDQIGHKLIKQLPQSAKVIVSAVQGDAEALGFAQQVLHWLKANGYNKISGVDIVFYPQPVYQQQIKKISESDYEIIIGTQK